jgi:hypothetical protein
MTLRNVDSEIWADEWFSELSFFEQALFIALFTKCADAQGRMRDSCPLIRAAVWPTRDVLLADIEEALRAFARAGKVYRYEADGKHYVQILRWWRYQNPRFAVASNYPAPIGWQDHVRATLHGKLVVENWASPQEHSRIESLWAAPEDRGIDALQGPPTIDSPYREPICDAGIEPLNLNPNLNPNADPSPLSVERGELVASLSAKNAESEATTGADAPLATAEAPLAEESQREPAIKLEMNHGNDGEGTAEGKSVQRTDTKQGEQSKKKVRVRSQPRYPPRTEGSRMFFGISPGNKRSWGNEIQRDEFETVEKEVGIEVMKRTLKWAAENEVYKSGRVCAAARTFAKETQVKRSAKSIQVGGTTWMLPSQGGGAGGGNGDGNGRQRKGVR